MIAIRNRFGFGENRVTEIVKQHRDLVAAMTGQGVPGALEAARLHGQSAKSDLLLRMAENGVA